MARKASTKTGKSNGTASRKSLSERDNLVLWVASGGRCAIPNCNKNLLFEEDGGLVINLADKAHIIAHSAQGPRGEISLSKFNLTDEDLDGIRNLMLLCKDHHKIVDACPEKYSAEMLFECKKNHEARVKALFDDKNTSLAVIHKSMDDTPVNIKLADTEDALILGKTEYREKFEDFTSEGWESAKIRTKQFYDQVKNNVALNDYAGLAVFPLSHIPLLIYLGFLIGDKIPVNTFQYERNKQHWVGCNLNGKSRLEDLNIEIQSRGTKKLVVSISASSRVHREDIVEALGANLENVDELHISVDDPAIDRVLYVEENKQVQTAFKQNIEKLHGVNRYEEIHLFAAIPAGLALELGRSINSNMWCEVFVYHFRFREKPKYQFAFKI
ncbi:SAVED domain-containing protein [Sporomusa sphaeroides]|uniref:SAVED domain-containing protein n=1 Tax=Sporomusa sphaeroides TaxID=47679 RepID=UPI002BC5B6B6|nr:SAVED domain-containing protein [Sporomusa sphaeroides]HML34997.1 SAVED domain-containing protein [Sporomusa sphaeroides]